MGKTFKEHSPGTGDSVKKINQDNFQKKRKQKKNHEIKLKTFSKNDNLNIKANINNKSHNFSRNIKKKNDNEKKIVSTNPLNVAKAPGTNTGNTGSNIIKLQANNKRTFHKQNRKDIKLKMQNQSLVQQNTKNNKFKKFVQTESNQLPDASRYQNVPGTQQKRKRKRKTLNKVENLKLTIKENVKKDQIKSMKRKTGNIVLKNQKKGDKLNLKKLEDLLVVKEKEAVKKVKPSIEQESLRDRMMAKLRASRFRYLNETLYNNQSFESKKYFKDDPNAFTAYHDGYKQQVEQWPLNPLDVIITSIKKMPAEYIIADFGCGEARLANSVTQKVHSFDFVSLNERVTACDMAHTPLLTGGAHVVVFCLSLMGTNLNDYIIEANRVLKKDGVLKIAEVESRFDKVEDFIQVLSDYGFKNTWKDFSHNLFYFLDFKKEKDIVGKKSKQSPVTLKPCLYKKR